MLSEKGVKTLSGHEGYKEFVYKDSVGNDTIGYGHLLTKDDKKTGRYKNGVSKQEALKLFRKDVKSAEKDAARIFPHFKNYSQDRKDAFINMTFNLGANRVRFPNMIAELKKGKDTNWDEVGRHMHDSAWRKQVKGRAFDLIKTVTGEPRTLEREEGLKQNADSLETMQIEYEEHRPTLAETLLELNNRQKEEEDKNAGT